MWLGIIIVVVILLASAIKIVKEYERGVIFRLGRLVGAKGPGFFLIIPIVDKMVKVSLRVLTLDVPSQEAITKDNVPVKVNAVCYFRVMDPSKAICEVQDYIYATSQLAQTTLRSVVGQAELDTLLAKREELNSKLCQLLDVATDPWGIKVSIVETKDVIIPADMQRAIAHQAEAERDRRAKIINAQGEFQAAEKLAMAGDVISKNPTTLQLRYLQTLSEISTEKATTVVFPLPIEFLKAMTGKKESEK